MRQLVRISVLAATMAASVAATAAPAKPLLAPGMRLLVPGMRMLAPGMRLPTINECSPEFGFVPPADVDVSLCEEGKYNAAVKQLEEEKQKQQQADTTRTH